MSWSIELSKYGIQYIPRGSIKSQALVDFVAGVSFPVEEEPPPKWALSVDATSNVKESGDHTI